MHSLHCRDSVSWGLSGMNARHRRASNWQRLLLVAVALQCGAGTAWGAHSPTVSSRIADQSAAQPGGTQWGVWQRHRLQFNCLDCGAPNDTLRLRVSTLLVGSGARLNAPVIFLGHGGLDYAELDYFTLQPVDSRTDTTAILGRWQSVRFQLNLGSMDQTTSFPCMLLYYFQTEVLSTFDVRNVSAELPCKSFVVTPNYHLAFEVFEPAARHGGR